MTTSFRTVRTLRHRGTIAAYVLPAHCTESHISAVRTDCYLALIAMCHWLAVCAACRLAEITLCFTLAISAIHLVTLITVVHRFGITFNAEFSLTLVACFDRPTSIAVRLVAIVAMREIQIRLALKVPTAGALLAHVFHTLLTKQHFAFVTACQFLAIRTRRLGTARTPLDRSTGTTIRIRAAGAFQRVIALCRQQRTVVTN